ncbi:MAG TPA: Rieske 2Fe-2S domain-containing protein [Chloroflexota bacterium]|nr:Rieske 2Fe-2S domain-containing protein [Chloroflexota bacterium]
MLTKEDNELICRVGPGTPMGKLMREYWVPAMLSSELPNPDSDPVRVLLLSEKLIGFRATDGTVGLIQNHCPHRGASLFFGRNEENGLRCVYHGWKFDVKGQCIDMPNEPAESNFKNKVKATAYPCVERGGVVWTYMGPRQTPPPLPDIEGNMVEDSVARAFQLPCNWLQIMEGDIDTVHAGILHYGSLKAEDQPAETFSDYQLRERHAQFAAVDTEAGVCYTAVRPGPPGMDYHRIAQFVFPFWTFTPPGVLGLKKAASARVPMDDEHTITFNLSSISTRRQPGPGAGAGAVAFAPQLPNTTDWYGRFRPEQSPDNDFLIDREVQRKNVGPSGWTGIRSIGMQDAAMTTSMGTVYDRTNERLGTTDTMIIRTRRRLIQAARALDEHGITPPGVDSPEYFRVRSGGIFLPKKADWIEATKPYRQGAVEHPELDPAINGPL